jgi:hypothetical protein
MMCKQMLLTFLPGGRLNIYIDYNADSIKNNITTSTKSPLPYPPCQKPHEILFWKSGNASQSSQALF